VGCAHFHLLSHECLISQLVKSHPLDQICSCFSLFFWRPCSTNASFQPHECIFLAACHRWWLLCKCNSIGSIGVGAHFDVGPDKEKVGMACSVHALCIQLEMCCSQGSHAHPCWQIQWICRPSTISASQKLNFAGILCEYLPVEQC